MKRRLAQDNQPLDELEDQALIARSLAGDPMAWAALIDRYERLIYSIPLRYGLSENQAADVFQSVCLILLEKLDQLNDHQRLAAWLGTTTRRECWRVSRHPDAPTAADPEPALATQVSVLPAPATVIEEWETYTALRRAFARLGHRCRALLERLYLWHPTPSYTDLAEELDMPVGSIGPTRARCLKRLHRLMGGRRYRVRR